jgi:carboxylesterase type B
VLLALGGWGIAAEPAPTDSTQKSALAPALLAGLESHLALTYARYDDRELQLDLHRPAARGASLPAVVCLHSGWFKGERGSQTQLALSGFVGQRARAHTGR